ncbi:MAG TPA: Gfo/Idh/MocA family oxidoreductase [Pirellulales bacterium]|jgi:predicted dehydrogenase|nr:Gfo/Idh/MocA family oxidoreductase [Pirellulales bacterium]
MPKLSRREMLENSMFAATAALASGAAGPLFAAEAGDKPAPKKVGPNEKIGIACIGVRSRGKEHLQAFMKHPDADIRYVVDVDETIGQREAEAVAKVTGRKPKWVADMRKAFEDPAVNAISTATPNHWHSLVAIWAMQAGKDVYVEKPVSHNVSEGRRAIEAARKYDRICQTGTQCRSMGGTIDAVNFVHQGKIGEVNLARGLCYKRRGSIGPRGDYPVPSSVNYDLWVGPAPMEPPHRKQFHYDWHWFWNYGCGDLGNQGIHQMDIARWGLQLDALPNHVMSYGGRLGYEPNEAGETANTQVILHDYGPKTLVFEVRGLETKDLKGAKVGVIFEGTEGYVVLTSYTNGAAFDKQGKMLRAFKGDGDHFGNFLNVVRTRNRTDLHADIREGHLSSALCHLGNISYRLGEQVAFKTAKEKLQGIPSHDNNQETFERFENHLADNHVAVDSVKIALGENLPFDAKGEKFTSNERANALLTRDYRAPYVVPAEGHV